MGNGRNKYKNKGWNMIQKGWSGAKQFKRRGRTMHDTSCAQ